MTASSPGICVAPKSTSIDGDEFSSGVIPERSEVSQQFGGSLVAAGVRVEGYQITALIGKGGMGTVWRAWQLSTRREVALKLLNFTGPLSERAQRRFDREVEIASKFQHPNLARIYDSGIHRGTFFYAMELIEGIPLDEFVKSHRLSRNDMLRLVAKTAQAMEHAHLRGVIHRDLKPANILVDGAGEPHIVDFGLAKFLNADDAREAISRSGEWAGTPTFMSPEQASGETDRLDTRTDVYSLGVVLYRLITGTLPHDGGGSSFEIMRRIREEEIVRPRSVAAKLDQDLEAILYKALAKDVNQRYPTSGALAADIQNFLTGEPVTAQRATAFYFLKKKARKHWMPLGVAAAVALVVLGTGVYSSARVARERNEAIATAENERQLRIQAELRLADTFVTWGDSFASEGRWLEARQKYSNALDIQTRHEVLPVAAAVGLLQCEQVAPVPLSRFTGTSSAFEPSVQSRSSEFFPDPYTVAWCESDGTIDYFDLPTSRRIKRVGEAIDNGIVIATAYSTASHRIRRFIAEGNQYSAESVDPSTGAVEKKISIGGAISGAPAVSPNGDRFACHVIVGNGDSCRHDLICVDFAANNSVSVLSHTAADCSRLRFRDANTLISDSLTGQPKTWSLQLGGGTSSTTTPPATSDAMADVSAPLRSSNDAVRSANGFLTMIVSPSGALDIWNAKKPKCHTTLSGTPGVTATFTPDNCHALVADRNGEVNVFPAAEPRDVILRRHPNVPTCLSISPRHELGGCGLANGTIELIDLATGKCLSTTSIKPPVIAVSFGNDGRDLVAANDSGQVSRFDVFNSLRIVDSVNQSVSGAHTAPNPPAPLSVIISPDATRSIAYSVRGACLWRIGSGAMFVDLLAESVSAATFSPDSNFAVVCRSSGQNVLTLIDLHGDTIRHIPVAKSGSIVAASLSNGGLTAYLGFASGECSAVDTETGKLLWSTTEHPALIRSMSLCCDGRSLLLGCDDGTMLLFDALLGRQLRSIGTGTAPIRAVVFSPTGQAIWASGRDLTTCLWDLAKPDRLRQVAEKIQNLKTGGIADSDGDAARLLVHWYVERGELNWAEQIITRSAGHCHGIWEARCYWLSGNRTRAVEEFGLALKDRSLAADAKYIQLCRDAAASER